MLDDTNRGRRRLLRGIGGVAVGSALAGCSGSGGDNQNGGDSGATGKSGNGGDQTNMQTTETASSYQATFGDVSVNLAKMPYMAVIREMLPEATNERFSGTMQQFRGGTLQMQAMVSGQIEFVGSSPGPVYQAAVAGNEVKVIATKLKGTDYVIALREDIGSLQEFVNSDLQFGTSTIGGLSYTQAVGVFDSKGINTENVNIVNIGGSTTRTQSIASGKIDGTVIHIDQFQRIQDQGVKSVGEVQEIFPNLLQQIFACRGQWLQEHEEYTQAFCNQLYEAHTKAVNDFEWVYQKAQKYQAKPLNRQDARETWEFQKETLSTWQTEEFNRKAYNNYLELMDTAGLIDASKVNLDDIITPKYWNNAIEG